jgi:hypothetical protein
VFAPAQGSEIPELGRRAIVAFTVSPLIEKGLTAGFLPRLLPLLPIRD